MSQVIRDHNNDGEPDTVTTHVTDGFDAIERGGCR